MNHKLKILIVSLFSVVISITTVYAVTLIQASDVIYDNSKSGGSSNNVQGAIDELYGLSDGGGSGTGNNRVHLINENMINYITNLAKTDTTNLAYDDTSDKNLRYIGADPNNYVEFNGELWRIIGVMNNIKDASGNSASRVKLIRVKSIGQYSYDNKPKGTGSSDSIYGSNDWTDAAIMKVLNEGPYWNRTSGQCPYDPDGNVSNKTISCDFSNNGLTKESKNMISSIEWNLGGTKSEPDQYWEENSYQPPVATFYTSERTTKTWSNGTITRPSKWVGYVGLIYESDYGYAVGGTNRNSCLKLNMAEYAGNDWSNGVCSKDDWLYIESHHRTMTPHLQNGTHLFLVMRGGSINNSACRKSDIHPVVYLETKLLITKGEGTEENPYKISFEKEISTDISNASSPKLDEEGKLKPVKLADDGTVTYVSQDDEEWYNYTEKKWANAVILVDSPSQEYKIGDTIKESDIESYFVWIPKYKYRLWNTGTAIKNAHEIDIVFDTKDTTDIEGKSCKTPMTSGSTGNCNNGEYMTHPAFISLGVNGFWVGKFETGYKGATSSTTAEVNSSDSSKIIIKPNVYSWQNNTVYNFFVSGYNYERNLDSHMMKNTEWGAVAYLSHSKYGLGYEVNTNNNSSAKTGYSILPNINQQIFPAEYGEDSTYNQPYNTNIGYLASTTGNISGIYGMSGGAHEYMASYISEKLLSSGFTTSTLANYNTKYFDVYNPSSNVNTYEYRILGDATGEMGPFKLYVDSDNTSRWHSSWYGDMTYFVESTNSWFNRGGGFSHGILAGQFAFHKYTGGAKNYIGSRIVLTG